MNALAEENCRIAQAAVLDALPLLERANVREIYLFGSRARGEATARDWDFCLIFDAPIDRKIFWALHNRLAGFFAEPIDLISPNYCANPDAERFFFLIKSDQQLIFSRHA